MLKDGRHLLEPLATERPDWATQACTGIARCGSGMGALILLSDTVAPAGFADGVFNDQLRVIVARKGSTWVLLHMTRGPDRSLVYQAVIEGARELD